jgi:hypothetical protein
MGRVEEVVETLTVRQEGAVLSRICLDFVVYTQGALLAPKTREGVLSFYRRAAERFGASWTWYETPESGAPRRVNAAALEILPHWLAADAKPREEVIFTLRDGEKIDDIGTTGFEIGGYGKRDIPGYLRLSLPVTFLSQGAKAYAALCEDLVTDLPFLSGRAGYSLRWDEYGRRHHREGLRKVEFVAQWYAGIDLPDDSLTVMDDWIGDRLPTISWLTFLGKDLVEKAGDLSALSAPIETRTLPHGLVIQAGPQPETGNSPKSSDLATYQAVAQALKPRLADKRPVILKDTVAWLNRFDPVTTF